MSTGSSAVLPAQYRMRRSADFGATVKQGRRAVQPDVVLYSRVVCSRVSCDRQADVPESGVDTATVVPPRIGLIIAKSVGSAVDRHRVARRLRHAAREVVGDLESGEQMVIRALPGSNGASSEALRTQLHTGLRMIRRSASAVR